MTTIRFARPIQANLVFEQLARTLASAAVCGGGGVFVATTSRASEGAPPADPGMRLLETAEEGGASALVVPPDAVLTADRSAVPAHEVIGRAPTVVTDVGLLQGPLDEGVLNPSGFESRTEHGLVDFVVGPRGRLHLNGLDGATELDATRGATARVVAKLRSHTGVRVVWPDAGSPTMARTVAGLAMAGVPLVSETLPATVATLLGPELRKILVSPVDLAAPLRREEHSIRLRRAALLEHSVLAWRSRLAVKAGVMHRQFPTCSIVLATKRPRQLDFALRQVAKQGAHPEVVVVGHGFVPDKATIQRHVGDRAVSIAVDSDVLFGDVLNAGVRAASGDLIVKMDDDDWYGPDFLTDLLLARHYSGADLVGTTAEYVYLDALDRTVRRATPSERAAQWVAGGTMMLDRNFLAAVGGFRSVHKYVDAQLLAATVSAGGSVYRTHGLGYLLRRSAAGHTWNPGADYFFQGQLHDEWDGFVPSLLMGTYDTSDP